MTNTGQVNQYHRLGPPLLEGFYYGHQGGSTLSFFYPDCCWCWLRLLPPPLSFKFDSTPPLSVVRLFIVGQLGWVLASCSPRASWGRRRRVRGKKLDPLTRSHRQGSTPQLTTLTGRRSEGPSTSTTSPGRRPEGPLSHLKVTTPRGPTKVRDRWRLSSSTLFRAAAPQGYCLRCSKPRR